MNNVEKLYKIINDSSKIVFFGGAGVSCASGIPDFRSANGIYSKTPEELVSHMYFINQTEKFYEFYRKNLVYKNAKPNECHKALAYLEHIGKLSSIITQNIDDLHQMAGSKKVCELHGSVKRNYCMKCHKFYSLDEIDLSKVPKCSCGGIIKPDVVLYEENLNEENINFAIKEISLCDTLIIAGTSLKVYPAASFIRFFKGKNLIIINLSDINIENSYKNSYSTLLINGKVEEYLNLENMKKYIRNEE